MHWTYRNIPTKTWSKTAVITHVWSKISGHSHHNLYHIISLTKYSYNDIVVYLWKHVKMFSRNLKLINLTELMWQVHVSIESKDQMKCVIQKLLALSLSYIAALGCLQVTPITILQFQLIYVTICCASNIEVLLS